MSAHVHGLWGSRCRNGILLMIQNLVLIAWEALDICLWGHLCRRCSFVSMTGIYPLFRWIHSLFPVLLTSLKMADSLWNGLPAEDPIQDSAICCGCHGAWLALQMATSEVRNAIPWHWSVWLKGIFWMPRDGLCDSWHRPLSWRQTKITFGWVPGDESEVLSNCKALGFCASLCFLKGFHSHYPVWSC